MRKSFPAGGPKRPTFTLGDCSGAPTQSSHGSRMPSWSRSGSVGREGGGQSTETPSQASAVSQGSSRRRHTLPAATGVSTHAPALLQALVAHTCPPPGHGVAAGTAVQVSVQHALPDGPASHSSPGSRTELPHASGTRVAWTGPPSERQLRPAWIASENVPSNVDPSAATTASSEMGTGIGRKKASKHVTVPVRWSPPVAGSMVPPAY